MGSPRLVLREEEFERIAGVVRAKSGLDLGQYRVAVLERRLHARLRRLGIEDLAGYLEYLESDPREPAEFVSEFCIKASEFQRNPPVYEALRVQLSAWPGRGTGEPFRVWSAGCGYGEEPYSVACLLEKCGLLGQAEIYATDLDDRALEKAKAARYPLWAVKRLSQEALDSLFTPFSPSRNTLVTVRDELRAPVRFSSHNLLSETPGPCPEGFHLVLCRNVLIYLTRAAQTSVLRRLRGSLLHGGWLCLGEAEVLDPPSQLELRTISERLRLFRKK